MEESEGRISALISKVKTLEGVNTDLNKKITNLDRRGKEQETMHKKQVLTTSPPPPSATTMCLIGRFAEPEGMIQG